MGDRCWARISFHVPNPVPEELNSQVSDEPFVEWQGAAGEYNNLKLTPGALFIGTADEVNYGNFDGLEEMLKAQKIRYLKSWEAALSRLTCSTG